MFTVLALLALSLPIGVDDLDEGYFLQQARRVLSGEIPYRDFDSLYTPGLLYLHSAVFAVTGGPSVVTMRVVSLVGRGVLALAMYVAGRSLGRPAFAVLAPLLLLAGLDAAPDRWEPHPGWISSAVAVLTTVALAHAETRERSRRVVWFIAVGAGVAVTFLFKQNAGAFLGVAVLLHLQLQGQSPYRPWLSGLRLAPILLLLAVVSAIGWLIRPYADPLLVAYLVAPVLGAGLVAFRPHAADWRSLLPIAVGFSVVTAAWLLPLLLAIGGNLLLVQGFVGAVNQAIFYYPPDGPTAHTLLSVGLASTLFIAAAARQRFIRFVSLGLAMVYYVVAVVVTGDKFEAILGSILLAPTRIADGLATLVPWCAALAGIWLASRYPAWWRIRLYLVAGTCLFLTQYPRLDVLHLAWSTPLLLVVGSAAVEALYERTVGDRVKYATNDPRGYLVYMSLLVLPILTTLPTMVWRAGSVIDEDVKTGLPTPVDLRASVDLPSLQGVIANPRTLDDLSSIRELVQRLTRPDEPIFVYPTSPLLYAITERMNPTRFEHFYPGAASESEVDHAVTLIEKRVRLVITSDIWEREWGAPRVNQPLVNAIRADYPEVAQFGAYRIRYRA